MTLDRTPQRVALALIAVLALVGIGVGAYVGRSTAPTRPTGTDIPSTTAAASATTSPTLTSAPSCGNNNVEVRPSTLTVGCGDSQPLVVTTVAWSLWATHSARGTGTLHVDLCTPDCVAGPTATYPATVTLARSTARAGRTIYRCITVVSPRSRSSVRSTTDTATCTPSSARAGPGSWGA